MKKISFLIMLAAFLTAVVPLQSKSQSSSSLISTGNSLATDTVTNVGVKNLTSTALAYTATVSIQVNVTKISGTLAGTIVPVASNDNVTYYPITGSYTVTDVASQGTLFSVATGYKYYGVRWTGSGTMAGSFNAVIVPRRP